VIVQAWCPYCHTVLTPLGTRLVCLGTERDCDFEQPRLVPSKISRIDPVKPSPPDPAPAPNEVSAVTIRDVTSFVRDHPWCSVPEIAAALRLEHKPIYEVLERRKEWKIQRLRATPRGPFRYALHSVMSRPGPDADHKKYALPWGPLRKSPGTDP
jgi:hypothetical protein